MDWQLDQVGAVRAITNIRKGLRRSTEVSILVSTSLGAFVEDRADEIEAGPRGKQRSDTGRIVGWRNLDKISADDLEPLGDLA
jgi:hypothetical protein